MGSEWKTFRMADISEGIFDGPHATPPKTDSGPIFLGISSLKSGRLDIGQSDRISDRDFNRWTKRVTPQEDDIVFSYETRLGEAAIIPKGLRCCLGRRLALIRPDRSKVEPRFLLYNFLSYRFQQTIKQRTIHGSTVDRIALKDFPAFPMLLPPLPEQRAIAHILGTLDDKIECNRRMNETLEKMAQAIFKSWFVDFDPVRWNMDAKNGKAVGKPPVPPEILKRFPDSFQESELGLIPKGWCTKRLEDVLSICETGKRPKGGVSKYKSGVPSIGAESILGLGRFDFSKTKYVPDDFFKEMNKGHISSRDVLLYKDGGKPGLFEPHVSMLGDGFPFCNCAINEHVYRIRSDHYLGQNFLFFWMSSDLVKEEMRIKGTGVAIPGLNSKQLGSIKTLLPTKTCLEIFNSKIDSLVTSILKKSVESRELMDLRDTLLPKLISGELRIKDAEKFIEALS